MSFTIGSLAQAAQTHVETIRYYQRRGLLEAPAKPLGGIRRYDERHVRRLQFIRRAQVLGFSLDEVAELLALDDGCHCREAERLGMRKLASVRERIVQLQNMERALAALVRRCRRAPAKVRCPMIDALTLQGDARPDGVPGVAAPQRPAHPSAGSV